MKFAVVVAIYLGFGAFMIFGLIKAVTGHPWWLIAALALFLFGFVRYGCRAH